MAINLTADVLLRTLLNYIRTGHDHRRHGLCTISKSWQTLIFVTQHQGLTSQHTKHTHVPPRPSHLPYSAPVFERVSEGVQRCNCYHLETGEATGDRLARTNWNHYSAASLVPVSHGAHRNVVSYCIQACAPPNHPEPL